MVRVLSLAVLGSMALSTVSAVKITFKRYSQPGCHEDTQHIAADTHLESPHCKTFDTDEPAFYSFKTHGEEDMDEVYEKYCYAVVYDGEGCHGHAFTYGSELLPSPVPGLGVRANHSTDMSAYLDRCADSTIPGRSVRILCDDTKTTVTGVMPKPTHSSTDSTVWVTQEIDVIETTHIHHTATDDTSSKATVTHHVDVSGTHAHLTSSATDTTMPTITLVPKGRSGVADDAADS